MKRVQKTYNGWDMQGKCFQWMMEEKFSINEKSIYFTILRHSLGFRKRWCYLKYGDFEVTNSSSIKKAINKLVEHKIISYKHTFQPDSGHRGMNEYKILEPREFIKDFIFIKSEQEQEIKKEVNEDELKEW